MSDVEDLIREEATKVGLTGCTNHSCYIVKPGGVGTNSMCDCYEQIIDDRVLGRRWLMRIGSVLRSLGGQVIALQKQLMLDSVPLAERQRQVVLFKKERRKYIYVGCVLLDTLDDAKKVVSAVHYVSTHQAYVLPEDASRLDADVSLEERKKIPRR